MKLYKVYGVWQAESRNWWYDGSTFDITAVQPRGNQLVGETVSKYGITTHYTAGTIYSKTVTLSYITNCQPTFIMVANTYGYNPLSAPGDSGGPWFRGNTAYGSHSGYDDAGYAYYMAESYIGGLSGSVEVMTSP
jgi:hypothetical protein